MILFFNVNGPLIDHLSLEVVFLNNWRIVATKVRGLKLGRLVLKIVLQLRDRFDLQFFRLLLAHH